MKIFFVLIIIASTIGCKSQVAHISRDSSIISRMIMFSDSGNEISIDDSSHTHINGDTAKVFKALFKYWMQLQRKIDSLTKIIDSLRTEESQTIYTKTKQVELNKALRIAKYVVGALEPHCDIVNIAGSCRREKPEVKDIELVVAPKMIVAKDMFGDPTGIVRTMEFVAAISRLGKRNKGNPDGRYMQIPLKTSEGEINLDLFMPEPEDYYRQFAIRTGSAEWTARFIAGGWVKLGWCGTDRGLRLRTECHGEKGSDHKTKWKCIRAANEQTLPPQWTSEEDFFQWLNIRWIHPKYRELR